MFGKIKEGPAYAGEMLVVVYERARAKPESQDWFEFASHEPSERPHNGCWNVWLKAYYDSFIELAKEKADAKELKALRILTVEYQSQRDAFLRKKLWTSRYSERFILEDGFFDVYDAMFQEFSKRVN